MAQLRFECPRCGNTHVAVAGVLTSSKWTDSQGEEQVCTFRLYPGRGIVDFYKEILGEVRKFATLRCSSEHV